jgi:acetyl esterase/lipase
MLDVYAPSKQAAPRPTVVFFYGGGWDSGNRADYAFAAEAMAQRGALVIVPDYRIYPEARYPDFLEDAARAVLWSANNAQRFGGDGRKLILVGHSAGAYNAMMLALDHRWLGAVGLDPLTSIAGVAGLAGPYDFLPLHSDRLKEIFGTEGQAPDGQPIAHVAKTTPRIFLGCDVGDKVVDPGNTSRLAAALAAAGGRAETHYYKGLSHALMIGVFAAPLRFLAPVLDDVANFIDASAGQAGGGPA